MSSSRDPDRSLWRTVLLVAWLYLLLGAGIWAGARPWWVVLGLGTVCAAVLVVRCLWPGRP